MFNGIINIYKEKGYTSFDVVAKLRGIFHQKKIGHTGTLDPDAEGVLPVCLGNATKVCELLMDQDKEYETVLLLGRETDTQDITGTVLQESPVTADEQQVRETIMGFVGSYPQVPPMYSARKVNGRKLYELAREGITIERKAKEVQIYEITILSMELPRVRMRIRCSKGTYIRTLCHDVGKKLGCSGCMEELLRTRVGDFRLEDARTIGQVEAVMREQKIAEATMQNDNSADAGVQHVKQMNAEITKENTQIIDLVNNMLQSVDSLFEQYPRVLANVNYSKLVVNGNKIPIEFIVAGEDTAIPMRKGIDDELHVNNDSSCEACACENFTEGARVRLYLQQKDGTGARFIGIYSVEEQELKPVKLFL